MKGRMQIPMRNGYFDIIADSDDERCSYIDIEFMPENEKEYANDHARVRVEWPENAPQPIAYIRSQPDTAEFTQKIRLKNAAERSA